MYGLARSVSQTFWTIYGGKNFWVDIGLNVGYCIDLRFAQRGSRVGLSAADASCMSSAVWNTGL